jgi:hypothetical protein
MGVHGELLIRHAHHSSRKKADDRRGQDIFAGHRRISRFREVMPPSIHPKTLDGPHVAQIRRIDSG